ncbi:MAG TPA: ankyrin repeat domain-containing protein [Nitrososphaera sp.]|nr:ankyrin repeat domain-containing protein [Nitrososphaera sp.]
MTTHKRILRLFENAMILASVVVISASCGKSAVQGPGKSKELLDFALFRACSDGNARAVRSLIDAGANVNAREEEGETPLMYAAVEGHTEIVLLLLSRGAEINSVSINEETALGRAASMGRTAAAGILIEKGANIEKGGDSGTTPLMYASSAGHLETVKLLLKKGAKVNAEDQDGDTALTYAAIRGAPKEILNELIAARADVKHKNNRGKTAEILAAENDHKNLAKLLKEAAEKH